MIKTLFCTSTGDLFAPGTAVMVYSLRKHLSDFENHTLKIFYTNLSDENKAMIKHAAGNIKLEFETPDLDYCAGASTIYGKNNRDVYMCLESFNQPDYDTVICFDSDMLCIADFDYHYPYKKKAQFAAVHTRQVGYDRAYSTTGIEWVKSQPVLFERHRRDPGRKINAGFWIASGDWIEGPVYKKMKKLVVAETHKIEGADQETVNRILKNARSKGQVNFMLLPNGYNFKNWGGAPVDIKRGIGKGGENVFQECRDHIKIIHYTGRRKPWADHISSGERSDSCSIVGLDELKASTPGILWHQYYEECFGEKCTQSIMV